MSWLNLNQSLNSLKGQITNFATEVLSEGNTEESDYDPVTSHASVQELEEKCRQQELEIQRLKAENENIQKQPRQNGLKDDDNWYWDDDQGKPPDQPKYPDKSTDLTQSEEMLRLRKENQILASNLEDLDSQHQQAMERLLGLKKELQKNFELLKQEHMDLKSNNDEYSEEIKTFQAKLQMKDAEIKNLLLLKSSHETLQHKYHNLERVHSVLRENTEKFQEENQELHEEVFKLQEQVTRLEHELEISSKGCSQGELTDMIPRERYEGMMKELNELKKARNTSDLVTDVANIDDNAKSAIENLKREINDLKHKLNQKNIDAEPSNKGVEASKIIDLINKYVDFELPTDYVGEMPADSDSLAELKLENALKTLKKEKDNFQHELTEKTFNITHLHAQVEDLTSENEFLTSDVQHFENELSEMKKNNNFLISEIAALKNTSKLEPISETHEDNIATLETELADCSRINKTFESKIRIIEKELHEVTTEKKLLKASLQDLKEKYTSMLNQLEACKIQSKTVEELSTTVDAKNINATAENDELKKRLAAANTRAEKLAINTQIIENDKVILIKQISDLKREIEKNSPIGELDLSRTLLTNKVKDLEGQLNVTSRRASDLVSYNLELEEKIKELESQIKLANETQERIKTENTNIIAILKAENGTLKEAVERMTKEFKILGENELKLAKENQQLKLNHTAAVEKIESEFRTQIREVERLKSENKMLEILKNQMETDQSATEGKIKKLEEDFDSILTDLSQKDSIIQTLNENLSMNNAAMNNLQSNLSSKTQEIEHLHKKISALKEKLIVANEGSNKTTAEYDTLLEQNQDLEKQLATLHEELDQRNNMITEIKIRTEEAENTCNNYEKTIEQKDRQIRELNRTVSELNDTDTSSGVDEKSNQEYIELYKKVINEKDALLSVLDASKLKLENKEKELDKLKTELNGKDKELTKLRSELSNTTISEEHKNALAAAAKEKEELISLINLKHNESVQYHAEIQRLNQIILNSTSEFKKAIEEKDFLLHNKTCEHCDELKKTLKEKEDMLKSTNNNTEWDQLKADLVAAQNMVKDLTLKCDNATKTLEAQLETVKRLTAENLQLQEKDATSCRELDRLRQHLFECQESYTEELMTSEQKLSDVTSRLAMVEERAKQTSTVYTSNSIRANQEVETYRNQIKLLEERRNEDALKLSAAEDAKTRLEVALANLQLVLEQFQLDKERDIEAATVKLHNKMAEMSAQNGRLQAEIHALNRKLEESVAGLQAAARLGDQLEMKSAQIQELKEQVRALQSSVSAAEERYRDTVSNQQDKVDRRLVKNLVLNYVLSQGQSSGNRTQVLRILSSVLDFNQTECISLGLQTPGVAGAGGVAGGAGESLATQFVRFLEQESTREPGVGVGAGVGVKSEVKAPTPEPTHKRNPSTGSNNLLFQNLDALETSSQRSTGSVHSEPRTTGSVHSEPRTYTMDTGVNQTRNNEGAILKHVLKDM